MTVWIDFIFKYLPLPLAPKVGDLCILLVESSLIATFYSSGFVMKELVQIKPIFYMPGQEMLRLPDSPKVHLRSFLATLLLSCFCSDDKVLFMMHPFQQLLIILQFRTKKDVYYLHCIEMVSFR